MTKKTEIYYIENAGTDDCFANLCSDMDKEMWRFGTPTPTYGWLVEDPNQFWWANMIGNRWHEVVFQNVQDKLEKMVPHVKNYIFKLINSQAIGKTPGLDGSIHVDHDFEFNERGDGYMTACYFPNKEWEPEWGGELQFFDKDTGEIIASFFPMPNSCVIFDSNIPHRGLAPRGVNKLRKAVTMKLQVHKMWDVSDSLNFTPVSEKSLDEIRGAIGNSEIGNEQG
jgi:hypothetical protein